MSNSFPAVGLAIALSAVANPVNAAERASDLSAFIDTIGVNTHISAYSSSYGGYSTSYKPNSAAIDRITAALNYLKIKHVRDAVDNPYYADVYAAINAATGAKFDFYITPTLFEPYGTSTLTTKMQMMTKYPAIIDYIEGPNEADVMPPTYNGIRGSATQFGPTLAIQSAIYAASRTNPALTGKVIQSSFVAEWNIAKIPAILANVPGIVTQADYSNVHVYFSTGGGTRHPGAEFPPLDLTAVWQAYKIFNVPFGQAAMMQANALKFTQGKPVIATESGFNTCPPTSGYRDGVDLKTQAKYMLEVLFDTWNAGYARTYIYELFDQRPDPYGTNSEYHFGLYAADRTPKPAAVAVANLMTLLQDQGPSPRGSLDYQLTGQSAFIGKTLLQRSDGVFVLALWNDVKAGGGSQLVISAAPPVPVTLTLGQTAGTVTLYDPLLGTAPISTSTSVSSLVVNVPDHPVLVFIK